VILIYSCLAINFLNFPLRTALLIGFPFILIEFQELFYFFPYFFDDTLIMDQCIVQPPFVWIFSIVSFFLILILLHCGQTDAWGYFSFLVFVNTCFVP
jgi:hypothetical protein